jgi:hypothetical protein
MQTTIEKKAGASLIVFVVLLVFTMVLHPAGGSIEHLIGMTPMIIITHSIAIFSLAFGWMGFWGLTRKLGASDMLPVLAFFMVSLGLVAVMLAAAANGLALPFFLQHYRDATPETIEAIKPMLKYNASVNKAFDHIYTIAFCLAILCWSVSILYSRRLPVWIAWIGIAVAVIVAALYIFRVAVNSLNGLRIFGSGILLWMLLTGWVLSKSEVS